MKNSRARFSAMAASAIFIFMSFAPGALGQATVSGKVQSGNMVLGQRFLSQAFLSQTEAGLLMLGVESGVKHPVREHPVPEHPAPQPPSNGCGNKNGGWDQRGGSKCSAVPEGGTTFGYLALVGLCCVATAIFSIRREARVRVTK